MLGIAISLVTDMQARGHTQFPGSHPVSLNRFRLFEPLTYPMLYVTLVVNYTLNCVGCYFFC